jgi:hypothetical protein
LMGPSRIRQPRTGVPLALPVGPWCRSHGS